MNAHLGSLPLPSAQAQRQILTRYRERTRTSYAAHQQALALLPGGVNRQIVYHAPHPLFIQRGQGAYVEDLDGNRFLDMLGNYTTLILGHCHPGVVAAVQAQLRNGTVWAGASQLESQLARLIVDRLPSVEQIRFTSSGTEAVMIAIRAARAHTGRPLIAKFEGGYHGLCDEAMVSVAPPLNDADDPMRPEAWVPAGIRPSVRNSVLVLPFNQPERVQASVAAHANELAAILVEPIMGVAGMIPPQAGFLEFLRDITVRQGILLIFDEVISFRVGYGGAQEALGVRPDLTILGKIIGGGFPVGALGGSRDVMRTFEPNTGPAVFLSGTFHANPVTLAAGIATLRELTTSAVADLNNRGNQLRGKMQDIFSNSWQPAQVTGMGSLFHCHLTHESITDYRCCARGNRQLMEWLHLALLNEGVMIAPRGMGCLSMPATLEDIDFYLNALVRAMTEIGILDG